MVGAAATLLVSGSGVVGFDCQTGQVLIWPINIIQREQYAYLNLSIF